MLDEWEAIVERLDFAFQPIVDARTGACYALEALLRGTADAGFPTIHAFFDRAHDEMALYRVDSLLRHRAIEKFVRIPHHQGVKLFYNLDSRVLEMPDYSAGNTAETLKAHGLTADTLCFEVSERYEMASPGRALEALCRYRDQLYRIALDDYGSGFSGLQLLYHSEPDFIKIDRFFIEGLANDAKKRLFVGNVVEIAHALGITVIGEGVETERELHACQHIGCDLVQGFLIAHPTNDVNELEPVYRVVSQLGRPERRIREANDRLMHALMRQVPTVSVRSSMESVLQTFRSAEPIRLVVVVNDLREPVGIVREIDVRRYLYNPYGLALLTGPNRKAWVGEFVKACPSAEVSTPMEQIIASYGLHLDADEGVILTDAGQVTGFLTAGDLLKAVNEKQVTLAREQNPLTRLPGNTVISDFISRALAATDEAFSLVHLDFDSFKPFNDTYGFRRGDRAIQMFANILRSAAGVDGFFVGHLGGDDFFAGFRIGEISFTDAENVIAAVLDKFSRDVVALYSRQERESGRIVAKDRDGVERSFPLLTCSAGVLRLPVGRREIAPDEAAAMLARAKAAAKLRPGTVTFQTPLAPAV